MSTGPKKSEISLVAPDDAFAHLTDRERHALAFVREQGKAEVAEATSEGMYVLFLHGSTTEEIRKNFPGLSLGQIVHARVRDRWDERRGQHDTRLLEQARANAQRVGLEAVEFVSRRLAAIHRIDGELVDRALASGRPEELEGLRSQGKEYRELIDLLLKLTGQDRTFRLKTDQPAGVASPVAAEYTPPVEGRDADFSPGQTEALLRILAGG